MLESLPEILIGIVVILVLSASMSTLSSLVLTSSSTLTLDLINPLCKNKLDEKKSLIVMRAFIAIFLAISVIIALNKNALISDLMGYSWGALAGAFLAPFMYGLFWKGVTKISVYVSFGVGVIGTVLHMIMGLCGFCHQPQNTRLQHCISRKLRYVPYGRRTYNRTACEPCHT